MSPVASTVFLVEDESKVREALALMLGTYGHEVAGFASAEAFLATDAAARPGCLVADLRLPGLGGVELMQELKRRGSLLPVVLITGHGDIPLAVAALRDGALNFIQKPVDDDVLVASVHEAIARNAADRADSERREEVRARYLRLTAREREVLLQVAEGLTSPAIAERFGISIRTVEHYRAALMEKMRVRTLAELVRLVVQFGLDREP
jgi:FixJ family two-component response regulator